MTGEKELSVMSFASREAWESWLAERHASSAGVWLKLAKKGTGKPSVSYKAALDVALCYGWIDGQRKGLDKTHWLQRFTPRRPTSRWSRINRNRALELIEQGVMTSAGLEQVERARADGRWEAAYEPQSTATIPDDLRRELQENAGAREFFSTLDSTNRYAIPHRTRGRRRPRPARAASRSTSRC